MCEIVFQRWPHRLVRSRTPGFQPGNTGSNPVGAIIGAIAMGVVLYRSVLSIDIFVKPILVLSGYKFQDGSGYGPGMYLHRCH